MCAWVVSHALTFRAFHKRIVCTIRLFIRDLSWYHDIMNLEGDSPSPLKSSVRPRGQPCEAFLLGLVSQCPVFAHTVFVFGNLAFIICVFVPHQVRKKVTLWSTQPFPNQLEDTKEDLRQAPSQTRIQQPTETLPKTLHPSRHSRKPLSHSLLPLFLPSPMTHPVSQISPWKKRPRPTLPGTFKCYVQNYPFHFKFRSASEYMTKSLETNNKR